MYGEIPDGALNGSALSVPFCDHLCGTCASGAGLWDCGRSWSRGARRIGLCRAGRIHASCLISAAGQNTQHVIPWEPRHAGTPRHHFGTVYHAPVLCWYAGLGVPVSDVPVWGLELRSRGASVLSARPCQRCFGHGITRQVHREPCRCRQSDRWARSHARRSNTWERASQLACAQAGTSSGVRERVGHFTQRPRKSELGDLQSRVRIAIDQNHDITALHAAGCRQRWSEGGQRRCRTVAPARWRRSRAAPIDEQPTMNTELATRFQQRGSGTAHSCTIAFASAFGRRPGARSPSLGPAPAQSGACRRRAVVPSYRLAAPRDASLHAEGARCAPASHMDPCFACGLRRAPKSAQAAGKR